MATEAPATGYTVEDYRVHSFGLCLVCRDGHYRQHCAECRGTGRREELLCKWRRAGQLCWEPRAETACWVCEGSGQLAGGRCYRCRGTGRITSLWCEGHHEAFLGLDPDERWCAWGPMDHEDYHARRLGGAPAWKDRKVRDRGGQIKQY